MPASILPRLKLASMQAPALMTRASSTNDGSASSASGACVGVLNSAGGSPLPAGLHVGSRTGARTVGEGFPTELFRLLGGFTIPPWPRFQLPPRQTERAVFPHSAFLFASCQGLWGLSCWERFRHPSWALDPVVFEQAQVRVQPLPTPPLPAEAPSFPCTHQMSPDLLFHPIFDKTKAPTGITHGKVADPAPQDRVDHRDHTTNGLRLVPTEYLLQFPQQCRALLQPGR